MNRLLSCAVLLASLQEYARLKWNVRGKASIMGPRECFYREQFGYCWQVDGHWLFQAVDETEAPLGEPVRIELGEIVFHHDQDEELH
ncbi:MAG TPA: hypothetical protein DEB56_02370 [Thiobacillus sp.]|nr:hypothetical protein [Thiobacillus sp.]